ncbi:MAG: hypothetical protein HY222_07750 [Thaumarchaeota archaeon]|jgi:hypothetical protein|nr:hypothetical protein [Nitrososphaerota archaeon]MBI3642268.1 hypothetical protein [Nitrososphaerota archaeon]
MKIPIGIIIVIGVLLLSIFLFTNFIFPDVICKVIHRTDVKTAAGQYNPDLLSDICSGIT